MAMDIEIKLETLSIKSLKKWENAKIRCLSLYQWDLHTLEDRISVSVPTNFTASWPWFVTCFPHYFAFCITSVFCCYCCSCWNNGTPGLSIPGHKFGLLTCTQKLVSCRRTYMERYICWHGWSSSIPPRMWFDRINKCKLPRSLLGLEKAGIWFRVSTMLTSSLFLLLQC